MSDRFDRFSARAGLKPVVISLQVNEMSVRLRNRLWNAFYKVFHTMVNKHIRNGWAGNGYTRPEISSRTTALYRVLWSDFLGQQITSYPHESNVIKILSGFFEQGDWNRVYDLLQYVIADFATAGELTAFTQLVNIVLEEEGAGYRVVDTTITPIVDQQELDEIKTSLLLDGVFSPAAVHMRRALELFSDRENADYRNSIKESISAVESVANIVAGDGKATPLKEALARIKSGAKIHPALEAALKSLYGWTSDDSGIRHALMGMPDVQAEDARFMLVACSAFVNYMKEKAIKANIDFLRAH